MDRIYVMQLVRSFQVGQISRRTFLQRASVAVGGMAAANLLLAACQPVTREGAVRPVTEATPTGEGVGTPETNMTTEEGLVAEMIEYPGPDGATLSGYLARPEGEGPHPGVIVIQEWWGLNEHIKDVTRRFAQAGYAALAPDLYHGQVATEPDEARKLVMELDMPAAVQEIGSAADYLLSQDYVSGEQVGVLGFCMGGTFVLDLCATESDLVTVSFYGFPVPQATLAMPPPRPMDLVAGMKGPILAIWGEHDAYIRREDMDTFAARGAAAGVDLEVRILEGLGHSFFTADTARDAAAARRATESWHDGVRFLQQHLAGTAATRA